MQAAAGDQRPGDSAVDVISLREVRLSPQSRVEAEHIAEETLQRIRELDASREDGTAEPITLGLFLFRTPRPARTSSDGADTG